MGKTEVDLIVLGVLLESPAHGYEVKKRIAFSFGSQYPNLNDASIYPRLSRFEKEGLVTSHIEVQHDAPNRKTYQLTDAGIKKIRELAATPVKLPKSGARNAESDMLSIHVVFFRFISKEERRKVIEPFYNYTKRRYGEALVYLEYRTKLDQFVYPYLEYAIKVFKLSLDLYQKLMETD